MSEANSAAPVQNKIDVRVALSWGIPWMAGMLFTIGYAPYPAGLDLAGKVVQWMLYFIAWPLFLGQKLGAPPVGLVV
jgi:hypothetical protein